MILLKVAPSTAINLDNVTAITSRDKVIHLLSRQQHQLDDEHYKNVLAHLFSIFSNTPEIFVLKELMFNMKNVEKYTIHQSQSTEHNDPPPAEPTQPEVLGGKLFFSNSNNWNLGKEDANTLLLLLEAKSTQLRQSLQQKQSRIWTPNGHERT